MNAGLWVALAVAAAPAPALRVAALANDRGLGSEPPLRFAHSDAQRLLEAFVEGARPAEATLHLDATTGTALELLDRWQQEAGPEDRLVLFLSSHGDREGAHLGDTILPWPVLEARLAALPGAVVIAFVDACQSGALIGEKGFLRGPPLTLEVTPAGPRGRLLFTSSGANEASHESALLGGSPFAHHLISGLRGAADRDSDGDVTVVELYDHVYARTVASTLESPLGPQRPRQRVDLSGAGDLVLSRPIDLGGQVVGPSRATSPCFILDPAEEQVVAELLPGQTVGLRPGAYLAKCGLPNRRLAVSRFDLVRRVHLDDLRFEVRPASFSLAKGRSPARPTRLAVAAGVLVDPAAASEPAIALDLSGGDREVRWHLQAVLQRRSDLAGALLLGGASYRLPWWSAGELAVGLEAGVAIQPEGGGGVLGQVLTLELPIAPRARLVLGAHALTSVVPARDKPLSMVLALTLGLATPISSPSGIGPLSPLLGAERKD